METSALEKNIVESGEFPFSHVIYPIVHMDFYFSNFWIALRFQLVLGSKNCRHSLLRCQTQCLSMFPVFALINCYHVWDGILVLFVLMSSTTLSAALPWSFCLFVLFYYKVWNALLLDPLIVHSDCASSGNLPSRSLLIRKLQWLCFTKQILLS